MSSFVWVCAPLNKQMWPSQPIHIFKHLLIYACPCVAAYLLKMRREGSDKIRQRFIPAWLTNLRLLWWISTEGACGAWCLWSTMGNSWGYDALLPPECGDAMGHWDLPLPGSRSCHDRAHAQHVKACIPIKFHQLFITTIIVTIFNRMRREAL